MHNPFKNTPKPGDAFEVEGDADPNGAPFEDGEYEAKLVDLQQTTSKKGDPMWVWVFVGVGGALDGKELKLWTVITQQAVWKRTQVCAALGLITQQDDGTYAGKFGKADAIGRHCVVVVEAEEYQGRKVPRVQDVKPHPKGAGYRPNTMAAAMAKGA